MMRKLKAKACPLCIILLVLVSILLVFYDTHSRQSNSPMRRTFDETNRTLKIGLGNKRKESINTYGMFQTEQSTDLKNWKRLNSKKILFWNIPFNDPSMLAEFLYSESMPKNLLE